MRFPGEYLIAAQFKPGQRPNAMQIDLFGIQVSIMPQTLNKLRGKTVLLKTATSPGGVKSQFLVAEDSSILFKRLLRKILVIGVASLAVGSYLTWKFVF